MARLAGLEFSGGCWGLGGEGEVEGGALAGGAGGPDSAAVLGDDAAADGEAEAGASLGASV